MKQMFKIFSLAVLAVVVGAVAAHAATEPVWDRVCSLFTSLGGVFRTLRTLCFAGAAFVLMGWGWGAIKDGDGKGLDEWKKRGMAFLIGFALLFGVGVVLQFLPGISGCNEEALNAFD